MTCWVRDSMSSWLFCARRDLAALPAPTYWWVRVRSTCLEIVRLRWLVEFVTVFCKTSFHSYVWDYMPLSSYEIHMTWVREIAMTHWVHDSCVQDEVSRLCLRLYAFEFMWDSHDLNPWDCGDSSSSWLVCTRRVFAAVSASECRGVYMRFTWLESVRLRWLIEFVTRVYTTSFRGCVCVWMPWSSYEIHITWVREIAMTHRVRDSCVQDEVSRLRMRLNAEQAAAPLAVHDGYICVYLSVYSVTYLYVRWDITPTYWVECCSTRCARWVRIRGCAL